MDGSVGVSWWSRASSLEYHTEPQYLEAHSAVLDNIALSGDECPRAITVYEKALPVEI